VGAQALPYDGRSRDSRETKPTTFETLTAFMEHYHKRSNIETAYSMIKGKFGSELRSKSDTGQINEVLCKVLAHNICVLIQAMHALNIHPIFRDVQMNAGRV
jgi:transposase